MDIISHSKSAQKFVKNSSQSVVPWSPRARRSLSYSPPQQACRDDQAYWSRDDELKERSCDKLKAAYQKHSAKENTNTKPQEIKLYTQQRAIKRAIFNYSVATKLYLIEQKKKQEEKLQKMIEEEEIRMLRKEMIPRAQLMPLFDRPFFPQRSNRPVTRVVPREQTICCCNSGELDHFQPQCRAMNPAIK